MANQLTLASGVVSDISTLKTDVTGLKSTVSGHTTLLSTHTAQISTLEIAGAAATVAIAANTVLISAINGGLASIDTQLAGLYGRETTLSQASYYIGQSLGLITPGGSGTLTSTGIINIASLQNTIGNLFMNSSGNVGIGTTGPSQRLQVNGVISSRTTSGGYINSVPASGESRTGYNEYLLEDNTRTGYIGYGTSTTSFELFGEGSRDLVLATNSLERMRITSAGNIAIGSTTASYKLDVNGQARFTSITTPNIICNNISASSLILANFSTSNLVSSNFSTANLNTVSLIAGNSTTSNLYVNANTTISNAIVLRGAQVSTGVSLQYNKQPMLRLTREFNSGVQNGCSAEIRFGAAQSLDIESGGIEFAINNLANVGNDFGQISNNVVMMLSGAEIHLQHIPWI